MSERRAKIKGHIAKHISTHSQEAIRQSLIDSGATHDEIDIAFQDLGIDVSLDKIVKPTKGKRKKKKKTGCCGGLLLVYFGILIVAAINTENVGVNRTTNNAGNYKASIESQTTYDKEIKKDTEVVGESSIEKAERPKSQDNINDDEIAIYSTYLYNSVLLDLNTGNEAFRLSSVYGQSFDFESATVSAVLAKDYYEKALHSLNIKTPPKELKKGVSYLENALVKYIKASEELIKGLKNYDTEIILDAADTYHKGTEYISKATAEFEKYVK